MHSPNYPYPELGLRAFLLGEQRKGMLSPHLFGEIHYDLLDMRSRNKRSRDAFLAIPLTALSPEEGRGSEPPIEIPYGELKPFPIQHTGPFSAPPLPDVVEKEEYLKDFFIESVLRYYTLPTWYNPASGLYSELGETPEEFRVRCMEHLREMREPDLEYMRRKYTRWLEGVRERAQLHFERILEREPFDELRMIRWTTVIAETREAMVKLFLNDGRTPECPIQEVSLYDDEVESSLLRLYAEALREVGGLHASIQEDARETLSRPIRLDRKGLHLHRFGLLWMSTL